MVYLEQLIPRYQKRILVDAVKGCWLWQGAKTSKGRGCLHIDGHTITTHKLFFILLIGQVPDGMELHHRCEVKHCCNPEHLVVTTPKGHRGFHVHYRSLRTHCPKGHAYTPENIRSSKHGWKSCRTCFNEAQLKRYHAKRRLNA
jgi:hypothetical protein